jgi:hypothetical protein
MHVTRKLLLTKTSINNRNEFYKSPRQLLGRMRSIKTAGFRYAFTDCAFRKFSHSDFFIGAECISGRDCMAGKDD